MFPFWTPAVSTALALGLAALAGGDDPPKPESPVSVEGRSGEAQEAIQSIRSLYTRLRKLRLMNLAEKPRALSQDAAKLYRDALEANKAGDLAKAKAHVAAAEELARALELSVTASGVEPPDPDLPSPPGSEAKIVRLYSNGEKVEGMPKALSNGTVILDGEKLTRGDAKGVITLDVEGKLQTFNLGNAEVRVFRSGDDPKRQLFVKKLESADGKLGVALDKFEARAIDEASVRVLGEQITKIKEELDKKTGDAGAHLELKLQAKAIEDLKKAASIAKLRDRLTLQLDKKVEGVGESKMSDPKQSKAEIRYRVVESPKDVEGARAVMDRAYKALVVEGDKADDASSRYVDMARDLYTIARREYQVGRIDRAADLASASEALTRVQAQIEEAKAGLKKAQETIDSQGGAADTKGKPEQKNFRVEVRAAPHRKGEQEEIEVHKIVERPVAIAHGKPGEHELEIVVRGEGEEPEAPGPDDAGPLEGIGVMLSFEDGRGEVTDLVPGGPALADGRIKKGDSLLGIETESGAIIGFADKELVSVTKLLRGKEGSKVKILVQPAGSDDRKVYELERKKLDLPKAEDRPVQDN